jgi:cytochrome c5
MRHDWARRIAAGAAVLLLATRLSNSGGPAPPPVEDAQLQIEGKQLFDARCATCHDRILGPRLRHVRDN